MTILITRGYSFGFWDPLENIQQIAYNALISMKVNLLKHLLQENEDMSRVLIFVNNKKISDMLHGRIDEDFEDQFGVIHSNKSQNYRLSTMAFPGRKSTRTYYYYRLWLGYF
jgi:superfamily II DNA/RNA helicase